MGSLYAVAIQGSTIKLAMLSEVRIGASDGDQTTSRTFDIPASGGFMIHERTEELLSVFREDEEVVCFTGADELVQKIQYYFSHPVERERIRTLGHSACNEKYSIDARAHEILLIASKKLAERNG